MSGAIGALADGVRRVNRAPVILLGVWILTLAVSVPLGLGMRALLEQHLGDSLAAQGALDGVNYTWWQEFTDQAAGLGVTFRPTIIGFGAVLDNLSAFLDDQRRPVVIVGAATAYIVFWIFLAGGIIDRYARNRPTRAHGFFAVSGVFFFRFLRLAAVMWFAYAALFGPIHRWLFGDAVYGRLVRDLTVERTAFLIRLSLYVAFGLLLAACNLVFDYAKVRAVVEDRRSMLGAIRSAIGFIRRNGGAALILYFLDFVLFAIALAVYALIARLWVKLVFWASETALFQARLAHAGYVAAPRPTWPDSPTAEAITTSSIDRAPLSTPTQSSSHRPPPRSA
jgi:hypothetical protein